MTPDSPAPQSPASDSPAHDGNQTNADLEAMLAAATAMLLYVKTLAA